MIFKHEFTEKVNELLNEVPENEKENALSELYDQLKNEYTPDQSKEIYSKWHESIEGIDEDLLCALCFIDEFEERLFIEYKNPPMKHLKTAYGQIQSIIHSIQDVEDKIIKEGKIFD